MSQCVWNEESVAERVRSQSVSIALPPAYKKWIPVALKSAVSHDEQRTPSLP